VNRHKHRQEVRFEDLWRGYFGSHVNGEESFFYILTRTLMSLRDVLRMR